MSQSGVTTIMVGSAVIAGALLVRQLAIQIRRRRWNSSASFVLLIACVVNLRPALGGFLHAFTVHTDVFYERTLVYAPSLNRLVKFGDRALVAAALLLVIRGLRHRFPLPRAAVAGSKSPHWAKRCMAPSNGWARMRSKSCGRRWMRWTSFKQIGTIAMPTRFLPHILLLARSPLMPFTAATGRA